jgi:glycosyltransferase involved in cell wall biosynthesis
MPPYQVIITSYRRPLYLKPTVESLRQSEGVQIFIVDGGSDPETCEYIKAVSDGCLFFRDNPGADFLKAEGIKRFATRSEFMLTSDDLVYPKGAVPWAFAQYRMLNQEGLQWTFCACNMNHIDVAPPRPFISYRGVDILEVETCQVSGAIIDTALCRELGYFPVYGRSGQGDWAFSKRLRERGLRMCYFRRPCLNHIGGAKWTDYPEYSKAFAEDLKKYQEVAKRDVQQ